MVFMSSRRATLHDVARAAGVSTTTASDALAGRGRVADRTRAHILEVASGLGYVASAVARGLRSGTAGVIGLFIPEETVGLDYYLQLMQGAAEAAIGEGLAITLVPPGIRREQMAALALDGLIVSDPSLTDPVMETVRGLPVPHVTLERDLAPDATAAAVVTIDHRHGVETLLTHLADQGARRIAALVPPSTTAFGADLHRLFAESDHDVRVRDVNFATDPEQIVAEVTAVLDDAPDAIVAAPDGAARLALDVLLSHGIEVPHQMLLAGYTDTAAYVFSRPDITAVDLAPRSTGRIAVHAVCDVLAGRPVRPMLVESSLRVRASTAGPVRPRHEAASDAGGDPIV
ncbi:putative LacI-family transcriptional regulator [Gordonia polyisoprenivorans VH2]|uniref:Putative LacI-family transcriptional regulator n=2 Tax=Gordonia polyisoprenivorans TaxID=84595 RepID=H6MTA2_GORPV|nr:putative LacI-family transcriptional regulator [Gordonia polyisoprenivorans VH2]